MNSPYSQIRDLQVAAEIDRQAIKEQEQIILEQQDRITELETQLVAAETELERLRDDAPDPTWHDRHHWERSQ